MTSSALLWLARIAVTMGGVFTIHRLAEKELENPMSYQALLICTAVIIVGMRIWMPPQCSGEHHLSSLPRQEPRQQGRPVEHERGSGVSASSNRAIGFYREDDQD